LNLNRGEEGHSPGIKNLPESGMRLRKADWIGMWMRIEPDNGMPRVRIELGSGGGSEPERGCAETRRMYIFPAERNR